MGIGGMLERNFANGIAAQAHERKIYGDAVKPSGKRRIAAKRTDFSKNEQEGLLRKIFGGGDISDDAQADGKNARTVAAVDALESGSVAALSTRDNVFFRKLSFVRVSMRTALKRGESGCELRLRGRSHFAPKWCGGPHECEICSN